MSDPVWREIGELGARIDDHDRRIDTIDEKLDAGFSGLHRKLDELKDMEAQRRGAMSLLKFIFTAGALGGIAKLAAFVFGERK